MSRENLSQRALGALTPLIPESPRFLVHRGRSEEAREIAARFGMTWIRAAASPLAPGHRVPLRVLPALTASEQAMPNNYNALLRVAQMELRAGRFEDAIAACDRGLERSPGPLGRAWLWQVQAEALTKSGRVTEAHRVLESALGAARLIGPTQARENNIRSTLGAGNFAHYDSGCARR